MSEAAPTPESDPLRQRLLDAAAVVFAERGYAGTRIKDIVREAKLSPGALYGRFESRDELLVEAATVRSRRFGKLSPDRVAYEVRRSIDYIATMGDEGLTDAEALQVELYVTARRVEEVANAIREARQDQRDKLEPFFGELRESGLAEGKDLDSVFHFFDVMRLGLMMQRAAGVVPPDAEGWRAFISDLLDHTLGDIGRD